MEQGSSDLDGLLKEIRARRGQAWITAMLGRPAEGVVPLLHALVVIGPHPADWRERTWTYNACSFTSRGVSTAKLAAVLDPGRDENLTVGTLPIGFDFAGGVFSWVRKPSLALYDELLLPWPSIAYTIGLNGQGATAPRTEYLVGEGETPSFPTLGAAYNAFYHDDFVVSGANSPNLGQLLIRFVDSRARIGRVRARPTALDVWVSGRALKETRLELNGAEYRTSVDLRSAGRVSLPLPSGLPSDSWIWLKDGTEWRDFRALSWEGDRIPNIKTELPRDVLAELSLLAAQGEGQHLEYKVKLPDTQDEKRNVFKTVVAFANGEGGTLLFGIDDGGELRGVKDKQAKGRRRLTDLLRALVDPPPSVRIETHRLEGRDILVLEVQPASGELYALVLDRNKPEYYVRRDGTTFHAQAVELTATVTRGLSPATGVRLFGRE
jgi:Putative DNA-binding domain